MYESSAEHCDGITCSIQLPTDKLIQLMIHPLLFFQWLNKISLDLYFNVHCHNMYKCASSLVLHFHAKNFLLKKNYENFYTQLK